MQNTVDQRLVQQAYDAFNARAPEAALATLHAGVQWDDGEGHMLRGHDAVRHHWEQQWAAASPTIEVIELSEMESGILAQIRLNLRKDGRTETQQLVNELTFRDGLIFSMRIR
jgi:hypothetical protein